MNIKKKKKEKKCLLCCTYNTNKSLIENHLRQLQKHLETYCESYEHFLIIGVFNADVFDHSMTSFCTLFKHCEGTDMLEEPRNPSGIVCKTCLSDFHKLVLTILRTSFEPLSPKIIKYRNKKVLMKRDYSKICFKNV